MSTDPKEKENDNQQEDKHLKKESPNEEHDLEDNDVQRGLTGESDDEEDVGGDLAGNAAGNSGQ